MVASDAEIVAGSGGTAVDAADLRTAPVYHPSSNAGPERHDSPAVRDGWSVLSGDWADAPRAGRERRSPRLCHGASAQLQRDGRRREPPRRLLPLAQGVALCLGCVWMSSRLAFPMDAQDHTHEMGHPTVYLSEDEQGGQV